jgi:hypothetical protein
MRAAIVTVAGRLAPDDLVEEVAHGRRAHESVGHDGGHATIPLVCPVDRDDQVVSRPVVADALKDRAAVDVAAFEP